jgi:tungstate transport system ATP-binding protein
LNTPSENRQTVLEVKDLIVRYGGVGAIDIPSLQVYQNEVLVIVGPNGSGKTTLLLCLTRLLNPQTGTIFFNQKPVMDSKLTLQFRRRLAVVFQESLLLNSSVWDNVTLGLRLRKIQHEEVNQRARTWLERFGIAHLAKRQARTLSSGEGKRTSLARAFVLQPDVLFLDEPFTALDSPTRKALLEDFESVLRETKVTTVMVTHDRNEALALSDRMAVLMNGRICQIGKPNDIFSSPMSEDIARFVEAGNILRGVVTAQHEGLVTAEVEGQKIDACADFPAGTEVILLLPYDDITLMMPSSGELNTSARNRFHGRIVKIFPSGLLMRVTVNCGIQLTALITKKSTEEMGLKEGLPIVAMIKAVNIHVLQQH